jgi:hypothetical protein
VEEHNGTGKEGLTTLHCTQERADAEAMLGTIVVEEGNARDAADKKAALVEECETELGKVWNGVLESVELAWCILLMRLNFLISTIAGRS